jgi:hypothetical protein
MTVPDAAIPAAAMARFTTAEGRLYPMVMVDPDGYQHATSLVGLVVDDLRGSCTDIEAVLQARAGLIDRLPEIAATASLTLGGVPADTIVDAASAIRCRELQCAAPDPAAAVRSSP